MSLRSRTSSTISMTRALARSSSVSLVLPLAGSQQKGAILCTLRRAQSSIPAVEYSQSDFANITVNNINVKSYLNQQQGLESAASAGSIGDWGGETDSYVSDYTSCSSPIADFFDVMDEPKRVSKEILRSVSLSFQWLDLPFYETDLPACREDPTAEVDFIPSELWGTPACSVGRKSAATPAAAAGDGVGLIGGGRQGSGLRFAYIHECQTGMSLVSHVELKTAMDSLRHWTMQVPRNCCLSYRHDVVGEVATLPWPDLEAGGFEEIEKFVSTVNRVEGKPVFFSRYERSPFDLVRRLSSLPPFSPTVKPS